MFLAFGYAHAQLWSFYPLSTFDGGKYQALSTPAQLQCSHPERGSLGTGLRLGMRLRDRLMPIPDIHTHDAVV